jgi:SAM-dependent methyltransferase
LTTYDAQHFEPLFAIEDKHFWFRSRNAAISRLVKPLIANFEPGYHILELGCGTGNTLRVLDQLNTSGAVIGLDLFHEGLHYARQRVSCPLVQGDLRALPFKNQFDLIALFDVFEHLPDDIGILETLFSLLKPGGYLMVTVPASMALWSYFDESAHHCRRYERMELESKLRQTGYTVDFLTPYMAAIFPLVWAGRRFAARFSRNTKTEDELLTQELKITPILNDIILFFLTLEARWLGRRRGLPVGTSLLAIAHRPTPPTLS